MASPSSSFKKTSPQQNPSPMPSTNHKKCLRLSTCILSTSLRFPHSKSSMSSLHTSFLSTVQTSKGVSTLSNFCATISSTSTFQGIQRPTSATQWFKSRIQVKHAPLKFIDRFGCAVHWQLPNFRNI